MSNRKRTRAIFAALIALPILFALAMLGSRGLDVSIHNGTGSPLGDLVLETPGGRIAIPRLGAGSSVGRTIHQPFAGMWGRSREVPLTVSFRQKGDPAYPAKVRCELGWWGVRTVRLEITEWGTRNDVDSGVTVEATMPDLREFNWREFLRSAWARPTVGPRGYLQERDEGIQIGVISRRNWAAEAKDRFAVCVLLAAEFQVNPLAAQGHLLEYCRRLRRESATPTFRESEDRLPFRDRFAVMRDPRLQLRTISIR